MFITETLFLFSVLYERLFFVVFCYGGIVSIISKYRTISVYSQTISAKLEYFWKVNLNEFGAGLPKQYPASTVKLSDLEINRLYDCITLYYPIFVVPVILF
eukprot:UN10495